MLERKPLYTEIEQMLLQRQDLAASYTTGFDINPRNGAITEQLKFFVSPRLGKSLALKRRAFRGVLDSLQLAEIPTGVTTLTIDSGWHKISHPEKGEVDAFSFGSRTYSEPVENQYDLINPTYYRLFKRSVVDAVERRGRSIHPYLDKRETTVSIYPDITYSKLMEGYQWTAMTFITDPVTDLLTHSISQEQFKELGADDWRPLLRHMVERGYMTMHTWLLALAPRGIYEEGRNHARTR